MIEDNEPNLANTFLAALAHPERGIHNYKKGRYTEGNRRLLQRTMIDAQRFVLDKKLVEHCAYSSLDTPRNLVKMAQRAIPPFETMFIEWNEYHRVDVLREAYKQKYPDKLIDEENKAPLKVGYLIQRLNGHFMFTAVAEFDNAWNGKRGVWPNGTSFYFSNDIEIDYEWTLSPELDNDLDKPDPRELSVIQKRAMRHLIFPFYWDDNASDFSNELDWFSKRVLVAQSPNLNTTDEMWRTGWSRDWMVEKTKRELTAIEGDLRFLIVALGFLNYDHIILEDTKPTKNVKHTRFGGRVPENEYRTVFINLPKRCQTLRRGILTGTGSPKKEHWRRGHWRATQWDKLGNVTKHTWIAPMKCGNPELGRIEHDYVLRGKKS